MGRHLQVSVIVCTRDRCEDLRDALESMLDQEGLEDLACEVVVVDNGSDPGTRRVCEDFAGIGNPAVRYVREERPGLSLARNHGLHEARGELVAFLDDDAIAEPGWVRRVWALHQAEEIVAAGGPIHAHWMLPRPDWATDEWLWQMGFVWDLGPNQKDVDILLGSNMVFRRRDLLNVGGFDITYGRRGSCLLGGEENKLFAELRALRKGGRVVYSPEAVVRHKIFPERLEPDVLGKRHYCMGIGRARLDRAEPLSRWIPLLARRLVRLAHWSLASAWERLRGRDPSRSIATYKLRSEKGYFRELLLGPRGACGDCPMFDEEAGSEDAAA